MSSVSAPREIQSYLESRIPQVPEDAVYGTLRSFTYSFVVSLVLSGGSPIAGLAGGTLAALATMTQVAVATGLKNLQNLGQRNNRLNQDAFFEGRYVAFLVSWVGALYLANTVGLAISNKASFLATVPLILWDIYKGTPNIPIMGTVMI